MASAAFIEHKSRAPLWITFERLDCHDSLVELISAELDRLEQRLPVRQCRVRIEPAPQGLIRAMVALEFGPTQSVSPSACSSSAEGAVHQAFADLAGLAGVH